MIEHFHFNSPIEITDREKTNENTKSQTYPSGFNFSKKKPIKNEAP